MSPARSIRSPLPNGDHASRMLSEPAKTVTPCAISRLTGGIATVPGPLVMMATPEAVEALQARKISELPVVNRDGRPVGLVDLTDLIGLVPADLDPGE